ncbi:CpsD/CapB family tyrosine-protein kinase [bacterium]|nr:CpsD/CapB family tyrosine-protein kinase [bacterium]MBU0900218.1 CpsD/CapB family tyrosine-protein kinase [bacterium]MBU1153716.1 CpsD/CapB family tyrosine-protein kinase [bacterium]
MKGRASFLERDGQAKIITKPSPKSSFFGSFYNLYDQLRLIIKRQGIKKIMVASAVPGEGKTTIAINIALSFATMAGRNTLLVDANLKYPGIHKIFSLDKNGGLTDVLLGELELEEALKKVKSSNLTIITAGRSLQNPAGLLGSEKMKWTIQRLSSMFDLVVYDTHAITASSSALMLSPLVDGIVMVVHSGKTRREIVQLACSSIRNTEGNILGVVLNNREYYIPNYVYKIL